MNKIYFRTSWLVLGISAVALSVALLLVPSEMREALLAEGSAIETSSAIAYFVAGIILFVQALRIPSRWSLAVLAMLCGARELDFDKRFTTMGIFKSRFFSNADVPAIEKLVAVVVIAAILTVLFFAVRNYLIPFIRGIRRKSGVVISVFIFASSVVIAKSLDGMGRKLEPLGITTSDVVDQVAMSIEEVLELLASLILVVGVLGAFRRAKNEKLDQRSK